MGDGEVLFDSRRLYREAIWQAHETVLKQTLASLDSPGKQGAIMWAIINTLYLEYCRARVEEMRRLEDAY